ncbi:MAG: hypothetical protein A3B81_00355 [Candidatus Muproteobacteria bacterium RIFCSPHIGHO2_02_FULL_65_16]|uniref:Uncharacterized protein n=1 Tax=Candidatus Muproteobacteria bacterium RIFCSPHIGHO2_02_FULL_65_16 TaxID=1817766 RepID=A0A1F6U4U9_9PROT|nr:MAG: hypothetical protein A3B81_00355 [Candidatus Muproteobacteria bacterium RIFCSPHIGHO2_02_FULL_65_16]
MGPKPGAARDDGTRNRLQVPVMDPSAGPAMDPEGGPDPDAEPARPRVVHNRARPPDRNAEIS